MTLIKYFKIFYKENIKKNYNVLTMVLYFRKFNKNFNEEDYNKELCKMDETDAFKSVSNRIEYILKQIEDDCGYQILDITKAYSLAKEVDLNVDIKELVEIYGGYFEEDLFSFLNES